MNLMLTVLKESRAKIQVTKPLTSHPLVNTEVFVLIIEKFNKISFFTIFILVYKWTFGIHE